MLPDSFRKKLANYAARQLDFEALRLKALEGDNVYCPICESHLITFLPFGVVKRANAQCPMCLSLERHRLLWLYLNTRTSLFRAKAKILHVAPETCISNLLSRMPHLEYCPADNFSPGYNYHYQTGTKQMDVTDIQYAAGTFDVILCNHVLEHVEDDASAMKELCRVLKPDGWAILQVPLDTSLQSTFEDFSIVEPAAREAAFGQHDHVRRYGLDYTSRLEQAGFAVRVDDFFKSFSGEERFKYGIAPEDIYFCRRRQQGPVLK